MNSFSEASKQAKYVNSQGYYAVSSKNFSTLKIGVNPRFYSVQLQ